MHLIGRIISLIGKLIFYKDWKLLKNKLQVILNAEDDAKDLPEVFKIYLIKGEDHRFYNHRGFDLIGFFRAVYKTYFLNVIEGGSTIEQQLVRTITNEKEISIRRKTKEIFLATSVEDIIPKDKIPNIYLKKAYFGWNMNGIYNLINNLDLDLDNINPHESCLIIARLKYPQPKNADFNYYNKIKKRAFHIKNYSDNKRRNKVMAFEVSEEAKSLKGQFLDPSSLKEVLPILTRGEQESLARQWISEGIPYFCQNSPMVYEEIRTWLACKLNIEPKAIIVIGSAKMGFSLSGRNFGRAFDENNSDLDLSIVSNTFFDEYKKEFTKWISDFENGIISPKNEKQEFYWERNKEEVPKYQLNNDFIDSNRIPSKSRYPVASNTLNTLYQLRVQINETNSIYNITKSTLRIYKDWNSFFQQRCRNLNNLGKQNKKKQ